jgi:hypothetical protein
MVMRFNDHPFGGNWSERVGSKVRAASLPFAPLPLKGLQPLRGPSSTD